MYRAAAAVSVVIAFGLLAWVGYSAYYSPAPTQDAEWIVEGPDRDLGEIPLGDHTIEFQLTNPAAVARKIMGSSGRCSPSHCFFPSPELEGSTIGPGETIVAHCELKLMEPGTFDARAVLYIEENGTRE